MHKLLISVSFMIMLGFPTQAQETICGNLYDTTNPGNITYHTSLSLDTLAENTIKTNKQKNTYSGYRIQIYFGSSREKANEAKSKFLKQYPDVRAYLIYEQPYFKIRVGDFRNRFEAQKLYYNLVDKFSSVLLVPDRVNFPDI